MHRPENQMRIRQVKELEACSLRLAAFYKNRKTGKKTAHLTC